MRVFTDAAARQRLAELLDAALSGEEVRIKRRDGSEFELRPVRRRVSPLDVPGVTTDVRREKIVAVVKEGRRTA
jgi:antitoxin (DNA-binding transcriptional repressor) of toxin-antitoxin stability system